MVAVKHSVGDQMFKFRIAVSLPALSSLLAALFACSTMLSAAARDIDAGRKIAQRNCARCHAIAEKGASPYRKAPPFRDIAAKGNVDQLQEALAEGIMVGHPAMPEFKLAPQQIADFLAYVKNLTPVAR
jgi:cytochrome c